MKNVRSFFSGELSKIHFDVVSVMYRNKFYFKSFHNKISNSVIDVEIFEWNIFQTLQMSITQIWPTIENKNHKEFMFFRTMVEYKIIFKMNINI